MTQHYEYAYGYPSRQPPITVRTALVDRVTLKSAVAPATTDIETVETAATSLATNVTTTDAYVASQGGDVLLYSTMAAIKETGNGQSSTTVIVYNKPQTLVRPSGTWSNSPGLISHENFSDGHYEDRTIASNGTYTEKGTTFDINAQPAPILLEEEASGAGKYQGPFAGCPSDTAFNLSAPSGSPPAIAFTLTSSDKHCVSSSTTSIELWYPTPPPFYKETDEVLTGTPAPVGCGKFKGASTTDVRSTVGRLDTVIGYVEITSTDTYVKGDAPVCIVLGDELLNYYDWQGDTPEFFLYSPDAKPISEVLTKESLVQTSASGTLPTLLPEVAAAARAEFDAKIGHTRATLLDAMIHRMQTAHQRTGGK
jgi:hypothetical protein